MTERYAVGPFSFTIRNDRVWWSYKITHFGARIRASGVASHSLGNGLSAFFNPNLGSSYAAGGLLNFVRYFMSDLPGALHWAEHYTRGRQ